MAWSVRGIIKSKQREFAASIMDFTVAIDLQPADYTQWINRSESRRLINDLDGAIADTTGAIRLRPEDSGYYLRRGKLEEIKGDLAAAFADFDRGITLNPGNPVGFQSRGFARDISGDFSRVLDDYEKSMSVPTWHTAYTGFWCLLLRQRLHLAANVHDLTAGLAEGSDEWTKTIAKFLGGSYDESAFLAAATTDRDDVTAKRRCEAFYYAGMLRLLARENAVGARELFEKCVATKVTSFSEYLLAKVELARLDKAKN